MQYITTENLKLPRLGLGTYRLEGQACRAAVESALALGYRHIDTAEMYGNEEAIGAAIAGAGIERSELHVTSKVWMDHLNADALRRAFEASLKKLKLDAIDLYLIHWPSPQMDWAVVFKTLMGLKEQGLVRAIGVANFPVALLRKVVEGMQMPIACNQVEYHVFLDQTPLLEFLRRHRIPLVAYCPLAQGKVNESAQLLQIGRKHGVSAAQVALAWLLAQDGVAAIPKAGRVESQKANLDALGITLDDEDRRIIAGLPKDRRLVNPGFAPKWDVQSA